MKTTTVLCSVFWGFATIETICGLSHRHLDNKKKYHRSYYKRPKVRRVRCKQRAIKICEAIHKVLQDKNVGYTKEPGMNALQIDKKEKKIKGVPVQCKFCLKFGHVRKTHKDCGKLIHKAKKHKYT
jgi:hypothetical protein